MLTRSPSVRPATVSDLESFYGNPPKRTVKAWVLELDGKILGVGGLAYHKGRPWDLFSDITEEAKKYPLAMIKGARMVLKEIGRGIAVADKNHPNSEKALKTIGLTFIGETESGRLYAWHS